jgi:hypothetical protein
MAEDEIAGAREAPQASPPPSKPVDWLEVLKVVAMPLVLALLGIMINASVSARESQESNVRLYADMMARREQADSDLRKDMFKSILDKFNVPPPKDVKSVEFLEQQIVNLELLAYNFHESIDLGPLFKHVRRQLPDSRPAEMAEARFKRFLELRRRLEKVAVEVDERQLTVVEDSGVVVRAGTELSQMETAPAYIRFTGPFTVSKKDLGPEASVTQTCLSLTSSDGVHYRRFKLEIIDDDAPSRELQVRLYTSRLLNAADCKSLDLDLKAYQEIDIHFWVGLFSLPMIDNTRLSHSERVSVSLTELKSDHAQIAVAYFPGSRASLKDKPYYDELEHDLLHKEVKRSTDQP